MSKHASENTVELASLRATHTDTVEELERYKLLVESVQDYAIFFMDKDGYIQTWNKGAQRFKGYAADEIIGKHFSNFYLREDVDDKKPERELAIARQVGRVEDEDWRVRKDGSRFWANVVITALRDKDGELVGFAKVTRDLTDRKRQENELRDFNTVLRKQREELRKLNESKDEFISLASHQLRTPATAIKQLLALLIEGFESDVPEHIVPILKKAYDSNERQIGIISSLLKVAQIDAGKVALRKSAVDINELVEDVIDEQRENFTSRAQRVVFEPLDRPTLVSADSQYFRMALDNIVDNASKYTHPKGTVKVTIEKDRGMVVVSVKDSGVGIGEADLATLFTKFKRIPNDLSQKVAGSGLGLYWVQRVMDLHDGRVEVESELGQGTTFRLYLPEEVAGA